MTSLPPRVVLVTRTTEYDALLERHGTRRGAEFFLSSRGQDLKQVESRHDRLMQATQDCTRQIPLQWRRAKVKRKSLDRFLFEPGDIVVTVGQDGLVANVAKYLVDQVVLGVYGGESQGVLAPHTAKQLLPLLIRAETGEGPIEHRTLVHAETRDGQSLFALNEIFVGHRSHQSARYLLQVGEQIERHSSSGIIVSSGTGATGWAKSIANRRDGAPKLPGPEERCLSFMVREAWASHTTGCSTVHGRLRETDTLVIHSEMNEGGVLFGDGVEQDFIALPFGEVATLSVAKRHLRLMVA